MLPLLHPATRSLVSRRGPVCFGDFSSGQATPKSYGDIAADRAVRMVLDFVNRFTPPNRKFHTIEQVAADHSLFGATLDEEERLRSDAVHLKPSQADESAMWSGDDSLQTVSLKKAEAFERAKAELEDFRAQRDWVAAAVMTFR